jgi:hypothetical protein
LGIAELIAFFRALPELVKVMGEVVSTLQQLRQDSIDKELSKIKSDVSETIKKIEGAQTNEDRKRLALDLALRMSK